MARTANDLLLEAGHNNGGRCEKCWREAAIMYAAGYGPYESHTAAYYAAMERAQDEAEARAALARHRGPGRHGHGGPMTETTQGADARGLRRRLEAEAGSLDPRYTAAPDLMREAAAALERVEALEKLSRNLLAVSRAVGVLGATEVSEAEEALDRLLATPASAGTQEGKDE